MDAGIYKITNLVNGKVYIGQSKELQRRLRKHREALKGNYHQNRHLQRSYNLYGIENFKFEIIHYVNNLTDLKDSEQYYIDLYESYKPEKGYNKARYVDSVYYPTEEVRKKISEGNKNKIITAEHRAKVSKSNGRKSKENQPNLSTGITNIGYLKREKYYTIKFKNLNNKFALEGIKELDFAILLRDLFYGYKIEDLNKYKLIFKQCNKANGYFNVLRSYKPGTYKSTIKIKGKIKYIKESKMKEVCALAYNNYVIKNNLNLPLNIIPLEMGVFKDNKWYCEIN